MEKRKMELEDIDRIVEITRIAWDGVTMHKLLEDSHGVIGDKRWYERKIEEVVNFCKNNPSNVIVAIEEGKVVGCATYIINYNDKIGIVENNAVDVAYQVRGIKTAMNKWIIDFFCKEKLKIAMVSTLANDIPAKKVYEKNGFKEIAHTIHYTLALEKKC
ncbi:MAG: GNAT family N-acetyltransferase [Candidatus Omnitrophica bacterium]|nr:GNAT family N-acetyltransferase [Candidatus Omnitrophota bacterium]